MRPHLTRRVLAGMTSLTIGGMFVAASAMAALADSPSPTSITANVATNPDSTVTVTVSGTLQWLHGGACSPNKGAGYAVAWGDQAAGGNLVEQGVLVGTSVATFNQPADNLVHDTSCTGTTTTFGPLSHIYPSSTALPQQVCAVAYHYDNKSATGNHSRVAGGAGHNGDNSLEEPNSGLPPQVCVQTVAHKPDVTITKTATPSVKVGQNITYIVTASNAGQYATDQAVTVSDPLPTSVQFVSYSVPANSGWQCTGAQTLNCTLSSSLAPGQAAAPITIVATATKDAVPSVTNTATVSTPDDSNAANNQAQATTVVGAGPQPDVTITKTATPSVMINGTITYNLSVTNDSGVATDRTLTVTDNVPTTVQVTKVTSALGWSCSGTQNVSCTYQASLPAGTTVPVATVTGTALSGAAPQVTNIADVVNPDDANPGNNEDRATTTVGTPAANLSLMKSADPADGSTVQRGQRIDYTLHYTNTGDGDANGSVISDVVPANTSYVPGSAACGAGCTASYDPANNEVDWSLDIPAHSFGDVTFSVTVDSGVADGTVISNVGHLTSGPHKVPSNTVQHLVFVPNGDLQLVKSVDPTKAKVGTVLTYTLIAKATGNIVQHNVTVTDSVPDGTAFKSADCASPCSASYNSGVVTWSLGDMQPGDSQAMTFAVTVKGPDANGTLPTSIPNVGHVRSTETPRTPSNRVVVPVTTVLGEKVTKTTPPVTTLPFTGLPVLQDTLLAAVLIGAGLMLLTWPRLYPQRTETV